MSPETVERLSKELQDPEGSGGDKRPGTFTGVCFPRSIRQKKFGLLTK